MDLNTREIAVLIWAAAALLFCLAHKGIRPALFGVVKAFFEPKIILPIALLLLYIAVCVAFLAIPGWWDWSQLKNTVVFSIAVGVASLLRLPNMPMIQNSTGIGSGTISALSSSSNSS